MSQNRARGLPEACNVALPRNPTFTGRDLLLEELRAALVSNRPNTAIQAVTGLGGVGKTQIALEYTYRYAPDYDVVWWIRAEEPATLEADFALLAHALKLPGRHELDQRVSVDAAKRWLRQNGRWLLIFDSARAPDDLAPYLVQAATGHVIITSRNPSWRGIAAATLPTPELTRAESIEFLLRRTGQTSDVAAGALADVLGDLPLALEQAGAYIERTGTPIVGYARMFEHRQRELLRQRAAGDAVPTVATTWDLAFEDVRRLSPAAAELLTLAAFLAPDDIPYVDLHTGAIALPPALSGALSDPLALADTVAALLRYSLIETQNDALSVHRLVQAVVREHLGDDERAAWTARAVDLVSRAFPPNVDDDRDAWPICARWLPHARAALGHAEGSKLAADATVRLLGRAGKYLHLRKAWGEARELYERALALAEEVYGPDHVKVAAILTGLGLTLRELGELKDALAHAERALEIDEAGAGPKTIAQDYNNLAAVLYLMGDRLEYAKELAERALVIDEREQGPTSPEVARDASKLASVLWRLGDLKGARANAERALAIDQQHLRPDDPELTGRLNNLGFLLREMGDLPGARRHLEQALAVGEAAYGPDDPNVATFHSNLASVLVELNDLSAARPHLERALEIGEVAYGANHYAVAVRRNNLGLLLRDLGDLHGAAEQLEWAVEIGRKALGPDHRRVKKFETNLMGILRELSPTSRRR